ncbi:MAG: PKD-like domain-containing protein [Ferruginibacter sp.]
MRMFKVNIGGALANTATTPVTVTFTITPTANGCPGTPVNTTVTVNAGTAVVATPSSQTICSGLTITPIAFSGGVNGTTYNWTRDNTVSVIGMTAHQRNLPGKINNRR